MRKKAKSKKRIRSVLTESMKEFRPIVIRRTVERHETEPGVVVGLSADWVLIASIRDGGYFDGYRAFRVAQLRRVNSETVFEKFLQQNTQWPPTSPLDASELVDPKSILEAAARTHRISAVFREVLRPGRCFIGTPVALKKKSFRLMTIDTAANWEDGTVKIPYKNLTQISFGGDYEAALLSVAGAAPVALPS